MTNTQIVDYVKGQLSAGVSREAILGALRAAGWAEADISDSIKSAEAAMPVKVTDTKVAEKSFIVVKQTSPVVTQASKAQESPANMPGFSPAKMFSDIDVGKKPATSASPMIQEKKGAANSPLNLSTTPNISFVSGISSGFSFKKEWLVPAISGVVVVACAAGLFFFYRSNADTQSQLAQEREASQASAANLGAQIAQLKSDNAALKSDRDAAIQNANQISAELGFFAVSKNIFATSPLLVDVRGMLGGTASLYTLLTDNGVTVYVKNSKDTAVAAALKPLVGTVVDIVGPHLPASRDLTAVSINGITVQVVSPMTAATSSVSTTTQ